jgi:hypothetical protein
MPWFGCHCSDLEGVRSLLGVGDDDVRALELARVRGEAQLVAGEGVDRHGAARGDGADLDEFVIDLRGQGDLKRESERESERERGRDGAAGARARGGGGGG